MINPDSPQESQVWAPGEVEGDEGVSGHIHFGDGLRQIRGDLCQAFPTAVYDVVATGARNWTVQDAARRSHK